MFFQLSDISLFLLLALGAVMVSSCSTTEKTQPPPEVSNEEVNVVTETKPAIVGGMEALYNNLEYPQKAFEEGVEAELKANVLVNKEGKLEEISFDKETQYGFEEAAEDALHRVQFVPGKRNEEPVNTYVTIPIVFNL